MKKIIRILISCLLGGMLLTETCVASICNTSDTIVFFGNGMKSIKRDAYDSSELIEKRLKNLLPPEEFEVLEFDISYNGTHTLPLDLLESSIQILTGNTSRFWRLFFELEVIPDWFADKFTILATVLDKSALITTDSLRNHVNTYQTAIAEGKKIVLVAHSQGNLFGNQAYSLLDNREKQSFGMVSVGNVDNNVLGNNTDEAPYSTLINDKVIVAIIAAQIVLPSKPMAPNTENLSESEDSLGHSFIDSYMVKGSVSDFSITGDIVSVLGSLTTPSRIVEPGVITVSLTWGSEPDVDLHVYEPNGTKVSWFNLQGISGALDRDDRSGWGPEHYHVPGCDTLEEGIYHIALDYFNGDDPETATIQVEAGTLVRTFEIHMGSEYYGTPNYPKLVSNILVKGNENDGYEFEIFE